MRWIVERTRFLTPFIVVDYHDLFTCMDERERSVSCRLRHTARLLFFWLLGSHHEWKSRFCLLSVLVGCLLLSLQLVKLDPACRCCCLRLWYTLTGEWTRAEVIQDHLCIHIHRLYVVNVLSYGTRLVSRTGMLVHNVVTLDRLFKR